MAQKININSTIQILKSIPVPAVTYMGLVALGSRDYPDTTNQYAPPTTFVPQIDPTTAAPAEPGTQYYDIYYQDIISESNISSPITNRWYITLTDGSPTTGISYNIIESNKSVNKPRRFPNEIKVGGWIAGFKEGYAWRIVKIFNSTTLTSPNCYKSPYVLTNSGNQVGDPTPISDTTGLATYVQADTQAGSWSGAVTILVEDVGFYNYMIDPGKVGAPIGGKTNPYLYFELNNDGIPNISQTAVAAINSFKVGGTLYYESIIFNIMSRFQNAGSYEDNIPFIQSVNNFKIGDAIAPLSITFGGTVSRSTLTVTTPPTIPLPLGTKPIESTHIYNSTLQKGSYIVEQINETTYRLNSDNSASFSGTFSYLNFVQATSSTYTSTTNAIGVITSVNLPSFQILSTPSRYSSTIIKPFTYKAFGNYYHTIPISTFTISSLNGIQVGAQLAVNPTPSNIPATSINDQFIVTNNAVSTIRWLYLGQDTLTGYDTGILNPFGGGGGGGGGGGIYGDAWFQSNIINPPPAPATRSTLVAAKSIILPWTYPAQTQVGFTSVPVPYLSSVNISLVCILSTGNVGNPISTLNIPLVTDGNSSNFINQYGLSTAITAIILESQNATPPSTFISTIGPPTYSPPINALIVRNGLFSTISSSLTSNYINVSYNNFTTGSNVTSILFTSTFTTPGPPANFSSISSIQVTSTNVILNLTPPTVTDTTSGTNVASITSTIIQVSTLASALPARAGPMGSVVSTLPSSSPLLNTSTLLSGSGNPATIDIPLEILNAGADPSLNIGSISTVLAPGTTYNFTVGTVNSLGLSTVSTSALQISTFTTAPVPLPKIPPYFSTLITFPADSSRFCQSVYSIYNISTSSSITNLISSTNDWVSNKIQSPLTPYYGLANTPYGQTFYNIAIDINSTIRTPGSSFVSSIGQQGWNASAWPAATYTSTIQTSNGIQLRLSSIDTYYFAPITYQGFYYSAAVDFTITSNAFGTGSLIPSPNPLMINMRQYPTVDGVAAEATTGVKLSYGTGGTNIANAISSTTFYYNGRMKQPIISSFNTTFTGTPTRVTGVNVYNNGTSILSTTASTINGYFYVNPIVQFISPSFQQSTIMLNDFTSTVGPNAYNTANFPRGGPIPDNVSFSLNTPLIFLSTAYFSSLSISTILSNPVGSAISTTGINVMIDPQTVSTFNRIPSVIQTLSTIDTFGMLTVISTIHPSSLCPPYSGIAPAPYDHSVSIANTPASDYSASLQITNGSFTANSTISKYAYSDYTQTLSNTFTYSISGITPVGNLYTSYYTNVPSNKYRFANFAWKLPRLSTLTTINFKINNIKNAIVDTVNTFQVFGTPFTNSKDPPLIANMRLNDISNPTIDSTGSSGYSTPWTSILFNTGTNFTENLLTSQTTNGLSGVNSYDTEIKTITQQGGGALPFSTINGNGFDITIPAAVNPASFNNVISTPATDIYVYLLIGLPTQKAISFDNVTAYYS